MTCEEVHRHLLQNKGEEGQSIEQRNGKRKNTSPANEELTPVSVKSIVEG
eukprot:m.66059 g.66059  ORF g.66059 m.66059 type:complete len:50 (-) comp13573_c0_seq1:1010-1159(-)